MRQTGVRGALQPHDSRKRLSLRSAGSHTEVAGDTIQGTPAALPPVILRLMRMLGALGRSRWAGRLWIVGWATSLLGSAACSGQPRSVSATGGAWSSVGGSGSTGGRAGAGATGGAPAACGNLICDVHEDCVACAVDCGDCSEPVVTECNDGLDNDGDGLVDWQYDVGCYSSADVTEASGARSDEGGWTTFDLSSDSRIVYVSSSEGDDANDGLSPQHPVRTPSRGATLVRDGSPDFLLLKRGDTWRGQDIGTDRVSRRFKSGQSKEHPLVISSYGDSHERPRLEINGSFVDHDGNERNYVAIVGLAFVSYPKIPGDPQFNGADGDGLRLIGTGHDILLEDNSFEYGEIVVQNESEVEVRRNVVHRAYHVGTCAYRSDGTRDPNGDSTYRPSGMFAGGVDGLLIEDNVWDENGWNPDVPEACATIYNHNLYLSGNSRLTVRDNLIMRAASIGLKLTSAQTGDSDEILIENNLFVEGEIGISMGGNDDTPYRFRNATIRGNVFSDIGRAQPTTRTLSWYLELIDNDGTVVEQNLLVNQPNLNNPFGIALSGGTNRNITIRDNLIHGLLRRQLRSSASSAWANLVIERNTFLATSDETCLVELQGGLVPFAFSSNAYQSGAAEASWFCVDNERYDLARWQAASGETGASVASSQGPSRTVEGYAKQLGIGTTLADFAASARQLSRHKNRAELRAVNVNNYLRQGLGMPLR